jgi:hypothetical protein
LPVLLFILLIIVDFGRALGAQVLAVNAAKQAAIVAARHFQTSATCTQPLAQQVVSDEVQYGKPASVSLAFATPAAVPTAYPGEQEVQATVVYSFAFITPFLSHFASESNPLLIGGSAIEAIPPTVFTGTLTPQQPDYVTATLNITSGQYFDEVGWYYVSPVSSTSVPSGTTFRVFQATDSLYADACPVGATVTVTGTYNNQSRYTFLWDSDNTDPTTPSTHQYWVVAYAPASSGTVGRSASPVAACTHSCVPP